MKLRRILEKVEAASGFTSEEKGMRLCFFFVLFFFLVLIIMGLEIDTGSCLNY